MKQKDVVLILVIVVISGIFSMLISNMLITPASELEADVEVVGAIVSDFQNPSTKFFNEKSNNPTQIIRIGEGGNTDPFSSGTQ